MKVKQLIGAYFVTIISIVTFFFIEYNVNATNYFEPLLPTFFEKWILLPGMLILLNGLFVTVNFAVALSIQKISTRTWPPMLLFFILCGLSLHISLDWLDVMNERNAVVGLYMVFLLGFLASQRVKRSNE